MDPAAALLGFAQTLTALDLFKLQQNAMLNSIALGIRRDRRAESSEAAHNSFVNSYSVYTPGVDNVAQRKVKERCDFEEINNCGEERVVVAASNPLNLRRHHSRMSSAWSNDSSDSERYRTARSVGEEEEGPNECCTRVGQGYPMGEVPSHRATDDKFKSDCAGCGDNRRSAAVTVVGANFDDDEDDDDSVAVDCVVKHEESPVRTCPSVPSTTSFTIERLIGRRT